MTPTPTPTEDLLSRTPSPSPSFDRVVRWALFVGAFIALFLAQKSVGFPRDESVYFEAGRSYAGWWLRLFQAPVQALDDDVIRRFFQVNREHPVLMKTLFGWSHHLFHTTLGILPPASAYRLPAVALSAALLPLLYTFGRDVYGRGVGLFAALSFFLVPRQLFNAVLACFDMPVATFWLLTVYCFVRAQREVRYALWTAVAFGLALATKHNALFLPFVLLPFALARTWTASARVPTARRLAVQLLALAGGTGAAYLFLALILGPDDFAKTFLLLSPQSAVFVGFAATTAVLLQRLYRADLQTFRAAAPLFAMVILGPILFYLHWPFLWHHPVDRASWYLAFHARHDHYAWFYLGELLRGPPFPLSYVVVKTALTVPTSLFVPMALGYLATLARVALRWVSASPAFPAVTFTEALILVNATASIAVISHPEVPHFGGVKHWLPSMPFLALLGGTVLAASVRALHGLVEKWRRPVPPAAIWTALSVLGLAPALIATARVHPYGTAYYSELAGGVPGAASLGMQRQFWSSHVTGVLPWINENARRGDRVYLHEVMHASFVHYQHNGMLREDLQIASSPADAHLAVYQYHQEFREHEMNIWQAFGTQTPATGLYVDETPQVIVYRRGAPTGPRSP